MLRREIATLLLMQGGGGDDTFAIYTDAVTPATFDPSWTFVGGGPMTVDWGDGSAPESHATGLSHTYASAGRKRAVFTCPDWTKLTVFDCNTDVCRLTLPAVAIGKCTGLVEFYAQNNQFAGAVPKFNAPNMTQLWLLQNQFEGTLPDLSGLTKLVKLYAGVNLTGYTAGSLATQKSMNGCSLGANRFTQSAIDNILADLVTSLSISGRVTCGVYVYGANTVTPSPAGWASIASLKAGGTWSIFANVEMGIIGDSISVGGGAGWPDYLKTAYLSLGGDAMVVNNHAVYGETIMTHMDAQCIAAANDANSHMILALGTNDNNAGDMGALQAKVEENIVRLKASNTGVKLYYMNILPRWTDVGGGTPIDNGNKRTAIAAACAAQSITCWDTFTTPWITAAQTDDGTHPNLSGKNAIRDQVLLRIPTATGIGA